MKNQIINNSRFLIEETNTNKNNWFQNLKNQIKDFLNERGANNALCR